MKLLKDGKRVIASNLCGIHIPINGMYLVYGPEPEAAAPCADYSYFSHLSRADGRGYVRVPVMSTQLLNDGKILFSGTITDKDLAGASIDGNTILTTATLVHLNDADRTKDLFVYSTVLKNQIKIIPGTYIAVNVGISIGD